jgi:signal peptidase I
MATGIIRILGFTVVVFGVLLAGLRLTCLRWWQVPEEDADLAASIAPTLAAGDWIILWRASGPGFGDLVVCPDSENPGDVFIGRIAGEPGDLLEVDDSGGITVNKSRSRSERACDTPKFLVDNPATGEPVELRCDIELLGGVHHPRAMMAGARLKPAPVKREVDPGSVFLVSDNRAYPFDSRDFGALPRASCKETVIFRLVSRLGFSDVRTRLSWVQ